MARRPSIGSGLAAALAAAVLAVAAGACGAGASSPAIEPGAEQAWTAYLREANADTYNVFIHANRAAAGRHDQPWDATGVEYQLRALEVQAAEAERTRDAALAGDVTDRISEIEAHDQVGVMEEADPGARERLAAAKARAARVAQ